MHPKKRRPQEKSKDPKSKDPPKKRKGPNPLHKSVREIEELDARIQAGAPPCGSNPLAETLPSNAEVNPATGYRPYSGAVSFDQLPISQLTLKGLKDAKYERMTEIQRAALPHALCGRDVLGAAKTGSGKTLAFIIPVIEKLYRLRWGSLDGVGALILSPTRELGMQIFEELQKVGKYHSFSGGLLIGGRKGVDTEKERVNSLNILVCTPGRLVQHMHETANFDCSQLQLLVLDEADRILDMGFRDSLKKILGQIPKERQTFLYSATQTRSVKDLATLSLQSPEYLAVHAESTAATPARLQQTAMLVPLDRKINTLFSFIKTHLRSKILVFLSSCKQVKFVHEVFKHLRPGIPIACLHGRMNQMKRMDVFAKFNGVEHAALFATDVAARGLDIQRVDWVVQVDCPEDAATYIHRVGRTARYTSSGRSLLFLDPSESAMIKLLTESKVPIEMKKPDMSKIQDISQKITGLLSKTPGLKYMAERAFVTYVNSIHKQRNKEVFNVEKLPVSEFAASLGLPLVPQLRFKSRQRESGKNVSYALKTMLSDDKTKISKKLSLLSEEPRDDDEDNEFIRKKRPGEGESAIENKVANPKKKLKINPSKPVGQRLVFDEEGNAMPPLAAMAKETLEREREEEDLAVAAQERFRKLQQELKKSDTQDRLVERQKLREKRLKVKQKMKAAQEHDEEQDAPRLYVAPEKEDAGEESSGEESDDGEDDDDVETNPLSLAEQEALALKLLSSRK